MHVDHYMYMENFMIVICIQLFRLLAYIHIITYVVYHMKLYIHSMYMYYIQLADSTLLAVDLAG